jgi:hypothetical protein
MHLERETGLAERCLSRARRARELSYFHFSLFPNISPSYINRQTIPIIREFFPQVKSEMLEAGHWGTIRARLF